MSMVTKAFDDAINQIQDEVDNELKKHGFKKDQQFVIYDAYDFDEYDRPINNLHEIPVKGKVKFIDEDSNFQSETFKSPTWLDISIVANKKIIHTKDYQNIHLEGVQVINFKDSINTVKLCTV